MASCPNCGRDTARTSDWVCQWCGYPLPSGSFKKLKKTFRELKEEREFGEPAEEEIEAPEEAKPEPPRASRPPPRPQQAREVKPPPTPQEPPMAKTPPPSAEAVQAGPAPKPAAVLPPQPAASPSAPDSAAAEPPKPSPPPTVKQEPAQAAIAMTVADLLSTFEKEGEAANARFANQILKVTGAIEKINVKKALDIYSITLNSPRKSILLQGVRCVFDRSQASELSQLAAGQTVTVQGRFTGSMIDVSLRDCMLIK